MTSRRAISALLAAALWAGGLARAELPAPGPVAVELYLSQACKACPPAAAYLLELAERPDVVALSWHIDYWDVLAHRKHGRWEDPLAQEAFADRQRFYNRAIRKRGTVFTPQAIVDGVASEIGSRRDAVAASIETRRAKAPVAGVAVAAREGRLTATVELHEERSAEVMLVTFRSRVSTKVKRGDNAGIEFHEANVVTDMTRLGSLERGARTFDFAAPGPDHDCALLVQERGSGAILAARYCRHDI